MDTTSKPSVAVSDLRQWHFCPRVVYWRRAFRAPTKVGRLAELTEADPKWISDLKEFSNCEIKRQVCLSSESLGLYGCLDALAICHELHPVEMKRGVVRDGHLVQLAAYAMLVEEAFGKKVRLGFLYYPGEKLERVNIDRRLRGRMLHTLKEVRKILETGEMPEPTVDRWKCRVCDHYHYCGGI